MLNQNGKKVLSVLLSFAMIFGFLQSSSADAAKKIKLSAKKVTVNVGKTKKISVKNTKKQVKWSVKKGKKYVSLTKKKKTSVTIKGKKKGTAVVTAKIGKKKLNCKVTVKKTAKKNPTGNLTATQTPNGTGTSNMSSAAPTNSPDVNPSQAPKAEKVENIVIDMTKINTTTFTASPAKINFASQLDSRFDLSYFKELVIGYELTFEGEDTSKMTGGKLSLAGTTDDLTGYADGLALTYDMMPGKTSVKIALSNLTGNAAGINIQPMDADANYGWPETLKSVTITSIEFIAKEDAVYAADEQGKPTPKPTTAPEFVSSEFVYEGLDKDWIKNNIDDTKPVVAISFDDGPGSYSGYVDNGMKIQKALTAAGAHATFFYIGSHIEHDEDSRKEVESAWKAGFEVANHSYDSNGLNSASADVVKEKIAKTDALLTEITGYSNFLFRAPNVAYSQTMSAVIEKPFIDVSIWSQDYQSTTTKEDLVNNVINNLADGGIINMHSVHDKTAEAVPEILEQCKDKGYQVVSVSELFAIKGKKLMTGVTYYNAQ